MNRLFIVIIRSYKRYLSPLLAPACRFTPTCSEYAVEAFEKKSVLRALGMTAARVAKCHPFHPGGYDPVDAIEARNAEENNDHAAPAASCCKASGSR